MTFASFIAIYFIVWWTCLFVVLPFGVKNQSDSGDVHPGSEPGAPVFARIRQRFLATTIVSAIVMGLLWWGLSNPYLQAYWY